MSCCRSGYSLPSDSGLGKANMRRDFRKFRHLLPVADRNAPYSGSMSPSARAAWKAASNSANLPLDMASRRPAIKS